MIIETKLIGADFEQRADTFGRNKIMPAANVRIKFGNHLTTVIIETSENSPMYDDLSKIVHKSGLESVFYFDLLGEPVTDHFNKLKDDLARNDMFLIQTQKQLHSITRHAKKLELDIWTIKQKWWYRLFKWMGL